MKKPYELESEFGVILLSPLIRFFKSCTWFLFSNFEIID